MSLTVNNPKSVGVSIWFPSNNDLIYTMSSTDSTQPDFYFKIMVIVNDNIVCTLRKYPIQGITTAVNVRDIVNAYISSWFNNTLSNGTMTYYIQNPLYDSRVEFAKLQIAVYECYNGDIHNSVVTIPLYVWNAAAQFQYEKIGTQNFYTEFTFDSANLTAYKARPMGYNSVIPQDCFLQNGNDYYLKPQYFSMAYPHHKGTKRTASIFGGRDIAHNDEILYVQAYGLDENGKVIKKAFKQSIPVVNDVNYHWRCFVFDGTISTGWTFYPNTDTDMNDCSYILYFFCKFMGNDSTPYTAQSSKGILLKLYDCPENFSVLYKSYDGGWNIIQCNHRTTETTDIQTTLKQNVNPTVAYWAANSRLITAVNVRSQDKIKLNTDWVNSDINKDIKDMLQSPLIYIQHYDNGNIEYIPVTLIDADYTTKEINDVNLFNYSFEFVKSYENNTIRQ